jgi:hypothetical protein
MRVVRTAAAGLAAAAIVLAASPVAFGASGGQGIVQAQPTSAQPGTTVTVYDGNQCAGTSGSASSRAFTTTVTLSPLAGMLGGSATLANVPGGKYVITITCGGKTFTGFTNVTVITPHGGAATGDGSSLAASTSSTSLPSGSVLAVAGAGVALGFLALRRRSAKKN